MSKAPLDRGDLARRFDEATEALERALRACPDELWETSMWRVPRSDPWMWPPEGTEPVPERTDESIQVFSAFANVAYHCLWFLDFYSTADPAGFESPEAVRGGPEEQPWPADGAAPLPEKLFSRQVLLDYLDHGRRQVRERVTGATDEELLRPCPRRHPHAGKSQLELLHVNLEHVRGHGADLLAFLAREGVST